MMNKMITMMDKETRKTMMLNMMPTGVSVFEKEDGSVEIATMNFNMMSGMFAGGIQDVLRNGGKNLEKSLDGIIKTKD